MGRVKDIISDYCRDNVTQAFMDGLDAEWLRRIRVYHRKHAEWQRHHDLGSESMEPEYPTHPLRDLKEDF